MKSCTVRQFESIESAQEYLVLLSEVVAESQQILSQELDVQSPDGTRHVDALRLTAHKLDNLARHLKASCRIVNDLRMLRRLLRQSEDRSPSSALPAQLAGAND